MKNIFLAILTIGFLFNLTVAQNSLIKNSIVIKGKVEIPSDDLFVYLTKFENSERKGIDSTKVNSDGTYEFKMNVEKFGPYYLSCNKEMVKFWAESEDVQIDFKEMRSSKEKGKGSSGTIIRGGRNNELLNEMAILSSIITAFENEWLANSHSLLYEESIALYLKNKNEVIDIKASEQREKMANYLLDKYSDCNSAVEALIFLTGDKLNAAIAKLEEANPNNPCMADAKTRLMAIEARRMQLKSGQPAPDFSYYDLDGKKVSLQDFRGKLLVIDFWASWCGACRSEIKSLKKLFGKYKNEDVAFLSISIDKDEKAWIKAVSQENMPWKQIHVDDAGKKMMTDYQFSSLPFIILLDKEGKIIDRNLRGEALDKAISEKLN